MSESSSSGKRPILVHLSIILATLIVVSGCVVGPHYKRPDASVPQAYQEVPPGWKAAALVIRFLEANGGRFSTIPS